MRAMIVKEFRELGRDRRTLAMVVLLPVVLLVIFGYAANFSVEHISTAVIGNNAGSVTDRLPDLFDVTEDVSGTDPVELLRSDQVDVVIDTKSVDTGYDTFNEHIQGEDFLDTAKYPTATFKSTKVVFKGDKPVSINGDLTIKGVTKPVTLKVNHYVAMPHPMLKKDAIGADASVVVKRTDFNAGKYAPHVGDDVTITISLEAIKG